jgi:hypothetical protein
MKSKVMFILLILIPVIGIKSQIPIIVSDDSLKIGKTLLPGLSVNIPESDFDKTLERWKKELKYGSKSKVVMENNEMSIFGANLKNISPNPVNVYSKLIRQDSMLRLFVSLEKKKDEYIERSTSVAEFIKLQDYMKQFAKDQYIEVAKAQSDAEDKKLYNLQQELSLIENKKSKLLKSIESDKALIISEKDNIALQNNELQTVDAAIKEQAGGNAKSDQIKELDKRKKKVLNSIESSERKIAKASNAIDKANNEIPVNEQKQARVKEQVVQQEAVSFRYADKLRRIREY